MKDSSKKGLGVLVLQGGLQRPWGCGRRKSLQAGVIKNKMDTTHDREVCGGKQSLLGRAAVEMVFGAAELSKGSEGKETEDASG